MNEFVCFRYKVGLVVYIEIYKPPRRQYTRMYIQHNYNAVPGAFTCFFAMTCTITGTNNRNSLMFTCKQAHAPDPVERGASERRFLCMLALLGGRIIVVSWGGWVFLMEILMG